MLFRASDRETGAQCPSDNIHNQQLTGTAVENLCVRARGEGATTRCTGVCVCKAAESLAKIVQNISVNVLFLHHLYTFQWI